MKKGLLFISLLCLGHGVSSQGLLNKKLLEKAAGASAADEKSAGKIEFLDANKKPIQAINNSMEKFYIKYSIPQELHKKIDLEEKCELFTSIISGNVSDVLKDPLYDLRVAYNNNIEYNKTAISESSLEWEVFIKDGTDAALTFRLERDEVFMDNLKKGPQTIKFNFKIITNSASSYNAKKITVALGEIDFTVDSGKLNADQIQEWENCYKNGDCASETSDKNTLNRLKKYGQDKLKNYEIVHVSTLNTSIIKSGTVKGFDCFITGIDKATGKLERHGFYCEESVKDNSLLSFVHQSYIKEIPIELKEKIRNVQ